MAECAHPQRKFDENGVRVCAVCGAVSDDQRSALQIAQEMSTKGGLVGGLFQGVADRLARKPASGSEDE